MFVAPSPLSAAPATAAPTAPPNAGRRPLRPLRPLLGLAGALLLAACGQGADKAGPTLRLQAVADPVEAAAYRDLAAGFMAQRPGVEVEFIAVPRHSEQLSRLLTAHAAGNAPDLFLINHRRWGQLLSRDLIDPLGPRLAQVAEHDLADFYPLPLEAFTRAGVLQCMPQNISSLVVYWNRELFAQAGVAPPAADWRWKEFHDAAVALTRDLDDDGRIDVWGLDVDPSIVRLAPFVWQAEGEVVDDVDNPQRFWLRGRGGAMGLLFLKGLLNDRNVIPPLAERRGIDPDARFLSGGVAMTLQSRRFTATLRAREDLDWDVAPMPAYQQAASVLHSDAYCLSRGSKHPDLARDFVVYATSEAGQARLAHSGRIVPSRRSVATSAAFLDPSQPPASAQVFLDQIPRLRRLPNTPNWYEIETRINPIIEEWMFEPAALLAGEANFGLVDGVRVATMIERAAGQLLRDDAAKAKAEPAVAAEAKAETPTDAAAEPASDEADAAPGPEPEPEAN